MSNVQDVTQQGEPHAPLCAVAGIDGGGATVDVSLPLKSGVLGLVENIDKESRDDSKAGACAVHAGVQEVRHKAGLTARRVP